MGASAFPQCNSHVPACRPAAAFRGDGDVSDYGQSAHTIFPRRHAGALPDPM
jgi:hypothetical protein